MKPVQSPVDEVLEDVRASVVLDRLDRARGEMRDLKIVVLVCAFLMAALAFGGWRYLEEYKAAQSTRYAAARVESLKLRAVDCLTLYRHYEGISMDECSEPDMKPYFDAGTVVPDDVSRELDHRKTWILVCQFLRSSPTGREVVAEVEKETGAACEEPLPTKLPTGGP